MRKNKYVLQTAAFITALCLGLAASASEEKMTLTGSSTIAPLALEIAKAFEKKNPGVRVDVQSGGSSRGIADARQGTADIGMVSRSLNPDENDLTPYTIAKDGICVILNKKNSVQQLTDAQIVSIYKGQIKNWKDVGGSDAPITVVNKAEGRSTLDLFLNYYKLKNSEIKASVVVGDNEQGIKTVAGNPNSIGYVSIGTAEFNETSGTPIKLLANAGVKPSTDTVKNGKFPLSRVLNLVTKGPITGMKKKFIEFAQSTEVTELVKQQYFVPATK